MVLKRKCKIGRKRKLLKCYTMLMSPNNDETTVHGCSSYLHCSFSGEAGSAHACRFWPNCGVEYGWFVLSTVLMIFSFLHISVIVCEI